MKKKKLTQEQWSEVVDHCYMLYNCAIPKEELRETLEERAAAEDGWIEELHDFLTNTKGKRVFW